MKPKYYQQVPSRALLNVIIVINAFLHLTNCQAFVGEDPVETEDERQDDPDPTGSGSSSIGSIFSPPHSLDVIRINETTVVLRWDLEHTSEDSLKFFKIQHRYSSKRNLSHWITDPREIPPQSRACQIDRLRPGNYFFVVIAVYDNDDNKQSEQFVYKLKLKKNLKLSDLPEQIPPNITWSEAEYDLIRFRWSYPTKERDITSGFYGFLVYYRNTYQVSDFSIYNAPEESVEIANLESDTLYEAKVIAYNDFGSSKFSPILSIKTKSKPEPTPPAVIQTTSTTTTTTTTIKPSLPSNLYSTKLPSTSTELPTTTTSSLMKFEIISSTTTNPPVTTSTTSTTLAPIITYDPDSIKKSNNQPTTTRNSTFIFEIISPEFSFKNILSWNDTTVIRYMLFLMIFIIFITCVIKCHQLRVNNKKVPPTPQADFEIIGYFQNSFPISPMHSPTNYYHSCAETT